MTKVVIDIPEKIMEHIKIKEVELSEFDVICKAIENGTVLSVSADNIADNIGKTKYEAETRGCFNCKYKQRRLTEEPCLFCNGHLSRWEDIKNGKS